MRRPVEAFTESGRTSEVSLARIVPMLQYEWRLVRTRYVIAMLSGELFITFMVWGAEGTARHFAPCPNFDWHSVASFFVVLSLAIALIESLNWVGWFITRDEGLRTELEQSGGDLFIPNGWAGPALALGLLAVAYVLRRPNPCEPLRLATMSLRDFVGTLTLAYGLLILTHPVHGAQPKGSPAKPE
jgi:hypothetical protein